MPRSCLERRGLLESGLTKLRPFCLEKEKQLTSPWRPRWEGRRQLQLQINVGQNFPSFKQRNKAAFSPEEGPRI